MSTPNSRRASWLSGALVAAAAGTAAAEPAAEAAPSSPASSAGGRMHGVRPNQAWWPKLIDLKPLRHTTGANPYGDDFDYAAAFAKLDLKALKADIAAVLTKSQAWWPADYGNYGPLFIRMAWHSAGTYRVTDGRGGAGGGQQRFEPLNSWPDNANLDKARRLLWPIKQKYGRAISWGDLMVLTGNVALESMGFQTFGFAGGRVDDWEAELVDWGPEEKMLADNRRGADGIQAHLAAVQMGLIYVNPEGPGGKPDALAAAHDIRSTFARMAMNDEETVALIAGGHTFGKAHGAHEPSKCVDVEPAAAGVEHQGMGWHNRCGKGNAEDTVTSGLEGAWTSTPAKWSHDYFTHLLGFQWAQTKSPGGATQWKPTDAGTDKLVPDAHLAGKQHPPMMFTTDLSLKQDPAYAPIAKRFLEDPKAFEAAFAKAWFKLTHRDLGPRARYLGPEVPKEVFSWQDPVPAPEGKPLSPAQITTLKKAVLAAGISREALIAAAWSSAATYRNTDMRGGANGARVRLAPQKDWAVNAPAELSKTLAALEKVQQDFNGKVKGAGKVSLADLIVLAGDAAIEQAATDAGRKLALSFAPGRTDASQAQTDVLSFGYLEPTSDGFRNYHGPEATRGPAEALVAQAARLGLSVPEMTALVGGLRVLGANHGGSKHGVFTQQPGKLSNDFFVNLLDLNTTWKPAEGQPGVFEGRGADGKVRWTATEADLVFGSNAELRAVAEVYAFEPDRFAADFARAWTKVMQADRFDLRH